MSEKSPPDLEKLRALWGKSLDELAKAPGESEYGRFREARFVLQVKAALETAKAARETAKTARETARMASETAKMVKATKFLAWMTFLMVVVTLVVAVLQALAQAG